MTPKGWKLSPAYDLNPSVDKNGLSLNIDIDDNALDFDLAMNVGEYFQLTSLEMKAIIEEVSFVVKSWREVASNIKISRQEQDRMEAAFRL